MDRDQVIKAAHLLERLVSVDRDLRDLQKVDRIVLAIKNGHFGFPAGPVVRAGEPGWLAAITVVQQSLQKQAADLREEIIALGVTM